MIDDEKMADVIRIYPERGPKIEDPELLAWCEFAKHREEKGFPIATGDQWLSTSSFSAGAVYATTTERARLLKLAAEMSVGQDATPIAEAAARYNVRGIQSAATWNLALREFVRRAEEGT